ncbi:zinc metalloprotease Zmp1 [Frigoribacterium salinisoli]
MVRMTDDALPSGITTDELDPDVRPQDDLFRHVNGRWIARTEIPEDKARYGSFTLLAEEAEQAVRDIVHESQTAEPGTEARKVGDLYTSFLDEERIERLGAEPLVPLLAEVDGVDDVAGLLRLVGTWERRGLPSFVQLFVDNDPGDPERYVLFAEQGGLGLPDESYYRDEKFEGVRTAYRAFVAEMLGLAGLDEPQVRADRVVELETALAAEHWSNVRTRDSQATYNPLPWAEAAALAEGVDLAAWRDAVGAPEGAFETVVVREPSFLTGLAGLLTTDRLDAWRDWARWQVVRSSAAYLSTPFVEANFGFYGRTLSGTPVQRARWKRGVSLVEGSLGEAVGRIYVERHFSSTAKASMDVLVDHLVEAYRQSIAQLSWMTDESRARALDKLEAFTPKIGFPVRWRDYSALEVDPADLLGNVRASAAFGFDRELGKIGRPLDRDEWFMTPQTINAYYNPGFNEIVFPAAILQFPFFDEQRDAAANYGAIGAVIGHEIGHGFDDQGSRYDGDGRLTDWWTADDRAAFERLTVSLIEQYDALAPAQVPDHHVNGALTIGENIGDLGGLAIAWKAYLLSLDGTEPPVVDGLTGAQRFFLSWAQAWQMKLRDEEAIRLLAIDPHSPNEFRCNQIVRNIDAFYDAFDVTERDALWLAPEARVTIW